MHHCRADDSHIYFFFRPLHCASLEGRVLSCIDATVDWMHVTRLRLKLSKMKILWCATSRRSHHISTQSFTLTDDEIKPLNSVCYIGAFFHTVAHVSSLANRLVSSSNYQMRRTRSISRSITTSMAITLMNSFPIARVDYCNSLLAGLSFYQIDRIQINIHDAARLVVGRSRRDHVTCLH